MGQYFIELFRIATGAGIYSEKPCNLLNELHQTPVLKDAEFFADALQQLQSQQMEMKVVERSTQDMRILLDKIKQKMETVMNNKTKAVENLKRAAEKEMNKYGPYKQDISFEDVSYFNAKKVVIQNDIVSMSNRTQEFIKQNINYLATQPTWSFKNPKSQPRLNEDTSTIHVPTNIYDKSMKILNGVKWTETMGHQYKANLKQNPSLTWQYFCSSDGFFRIYPGMQWPRNADKVDTFDCRVRQWYIQAATSPKNIIILLDASGSMKGLRFSIAKSTVFTILDTLSEEDYFNVIAFSEEPSYVVECFNGTLMPASLDNIRRMQDMIEDLQPKKYANFEKALTLAFNLFKTEIHLHEGKICNKAIMLITDGAPDNFEYIFDHFNWPKKATRVFTFLIGKEVQDNRQARWMACANKGKFTHISTRADVQENVQKYVKVLSRPLANGNATHKVWSSVYLDYVTQQSDITALTTQHTQLELDYETQFLFEGLGLVMSISMPVFDKRSKDRVGLTEEDPTRNMLGIVGADMRVNELMKLLPTFELGVNGYPFAITNHGYILFHPDYKPFYIEQKSGVLRLKTRPKYNSVELSEVERPAEVNPYGNREHPLSHYLLSPMTGYSECSVITQFDNMKRVENRTNLYQFMEIMDTFRLVFVVPKGYGQYKIKFDDKPEETWEKFNDTDFKLDISTTDYAPWIYCKSLVGDDLQHFAGRQAHVYLSDPDILFSKCDKEHAHHILKDLLFAFEYIKVWQGLQFNHLRSSRNKIYIKKYLDCYDRTNIASKRICFAQAHHSYGIKFIWIATRSGVTKHVNFDPHDMLRVFTKTQTIREVEYQRTVSLWNAGYEYIFTGPIPASQMDFDPEISKIVISHAELVGNKKQVPAAIVAFTMSYSAFYDVFVRYTFECQQEPCPYTCNDTEHFTCYIIDNNGYILAVNNPSMNGTSLFLGEEDGYLMRALVDDQIFEQIQMTDYQSICETRIQSGQDNASNFKLNPLQLISKFMVWLATEIVILLSHLTVMTWHGISGVMGLEDTVNVGEDKECGHWIPEAYVRYIFCGFVIDTATGERIRANFVTKMRSCEQKVTRYNLNLNALKRTETISSISPCHLQCQQKHPSYHVKRLNQTNLLFLVADNTCHCNSSHSFGHDEQEDDYYYDYEVELANSQKKKKDKYLFSLRPEEVTYHENEQCQRLRNLSEELKRFDKTRRNNSICFDSRNEKDTPCNQSPAVSLSLELVVSIVLLSVLYAWNEGSTKSL